MWSQAFRSPRLVRGMNGQIAGPMSYGIIQFGFSAAGPLWPESTRREAGEPASRAAAGIRVGSQPSNGEGCRPKRASGGQLQLLLHSLVARVLHALSQPGGAEATMCKRREVRGPDD